VSLSLKTAEEKKAAVNSPLPQSTMKKTRRGREQRVFLNDMALSKASGLNPGQKIKVKLELDTNPARGAKSEIRKLYFPKSHQIVCYNVETEMAGKVAAVLCRAYTKGRDFWDLLFHLNKKTVINAEYLRNALLQNERYKKLPPKVTAKWLKAELERKIDTMDLALVKRDVGRFLIDDTKTRHWNRAFFKGRIRDLKVQRGQERGREL
jgi:hypothetical protein